MAVVITACTNRKRCVPSAELRADALPVGALDVVASSWKGCLARAGERVPAHELYLGRGFREAATAAVELQARFYIASAGLGLIEAATPVPPYALSVAEGSSDNVLLRITDGADAADWWAAGARQSPFSRPIDEVVHASEGPIILALSSAYLAMIASDLAGLPAAHRARLRIATRAPLRDIAPALHPYVLPYDDRLDGVDGYAGTLNDFAGRAARHFAGLVSRMGGQGDIRAHEASIQEALSPYRIRVLPERQSLSNEAILDLIRDHWEAGKGQTGRLLRIVRDELRVRCEQSRFAGLVQRVREEKGAGL